MYKIFSYLLSSFFITRQAWAGDELVNNITAFLEFLLVPIVSILAFLFLGAPYELFGHELQINIFGLPLYVAWLIFGAIFFTFKLNFVNIRLFAHGIAIVRGKYHEDSAKAPGKVTHLQALFTAVSATVGLGNIAGVAIAISLGGPGAVIWMMLAAFFGMSLKFAEVTLGQKYRKFDQEGHLMAGAFYYLEDGLKNLKKAKLGLILGKFAALCCVGGAIGAGLMFQANQATAILVDSFALSNFTKFLLVACLAGLIAFILLGGITRIAQIAAKIVPFMALTYIISCLVIIFVNFSALPTALATMFSSAFSDNALYGGVIGAIVQGFKRAAFSNEAGLGSAPIAHAAAKTTEPVREGCVALLEPFIDTIIICFMTGLVITVTGAYLETGLDSGVLITKDAFATVSAGFTYVLSAIVVLFAFSTMLTYSYYGQQAWVYLSKDPKNLKTCHTLFALCVFIGGMLNLGIVIDFADILFLSMAVPNLIGLYLMRNEIKQEVDKYVGKYL